MTGAHIKHLYSNVCSIGNNRRNQSLVCSCSVMILLASKKHGRQAQQGWRVTFYVRQQWACENICLGMDGDGELAEGLWVRIS